MNDNKSFDIYEFNNKDKIVKYDYIIKSLEENFNYSLELLDYATQKNQTFDYYQLVESKVN